jgi:hypothetical protein
MEAKRIKLTSFQLYTQHTVDILFDDEKDTSKSWLSSRIITLYVLFILIVPRDWSKD